MTTPEDPFAVVRTRQYAVLLIMAAVLGVVISFLVYWYLKLVTDLQTWVFTDLPKGLGFHGEPPWWPLLPLAVAGALVGATIRYLPGRGGHSPADGFHPGGIAAPAYLPGIFLASLAGLSLGAVIGPEAPTIALGGGLAVLAVKLVRRDVPQQTAAVLAATGSFAAISTLLGNPLSGAVLLLEASGLGGATATIALLPGLVGAGIGSLIFLGLGSLTGYGTFSLAVPDLPPAAHLNIGQLGWAVAIGAAAAVVSFGIKRLALLVRPHLERFLLLLTPLAGLAVAGLAIAYAEGTGKPSSDVLFSGQSALPPLLEHSASYTAGALALLLVCKGLAYSISLAGFRGGPIFPSMFIGAAGGIALSHLPGLPLVAGAAIGIGAMVAGMLQLPISAVLLTTLFLGTDGVATMPLTIIAVVTSFVLVKWLTGPPAQPAAESPSQPAAESPPQGDAELPHSRRTLPGVMNMTESYDVIIVGTGAGGGTLARTLAPSGKRILLLERGDFLTRERENWDPGPVFVDGRYISPDTWYDGAGTPFQPQVHYFVGGATKLYGAALYRLRPQDFAEIQHADGISPAWPVGYDEFEPWYTKAEWLYQVHGAHGTDPTEGSWSRQYRWPPVAHEPRIQEISDSLEQGGYHPFPAPCGILLNEADRPASQCIRCATCDGYPCLVHAKADADIIAVRPLLGLPTVTLLTRAEVVRLETDPAGRTVTGVVVDRGGDGRGGPGGKEEVYHGDIVVLAAGAANTAKILLRSASEACPAGLANGSDQVGRNYMYHNSKAAVALGKEPNDTVFQKTLAINDFYFAGDDRQWPLGNIQMLGKSNAMAMKGEEPHLTRLAPQWSLEEVARHAVDFWLTTEDLPTPDNRVTVDRDGNVHLAYTDTNDAEAAALYGEFRKLLNHIGMSEHHVLHKNFYMSMNVPIAGVAHQAGTCRFGADPATSVLDVNCKAHEVDNLYVTDTSFFPSIGAVNPALTAIANAIRVGEHIAERLGASVSASASAESWAPAQRQAPAQTAEAPSAAERS